MRPAAPQVPLIGIGVGLLPAPRRRREHRAEHAQVDLPEPGPLLKAPRTQYDRREEDAEVREVEHDALGLVAPDVLLVAHGARAAALTPLRTVLTAAALLLCGRMSRSGRVRLTNCSSGFKPNQCFSW